MSLRNNPLEIYKFFQKSNCRQCQVPTCLAFAASVIKGQKRLDECPHLESNMIERLNAKIDRRMTLKQQQVQSKDVMGTVPLAQEIDLVCQRNCPYGKVF